MSSKKSCGKIRAYQSVGDRWQRAGVAEAQCLKLPQADSIYPQDTRRHKNHFDGPSFSMGNSSSKNRSSNSRKTAMNTSYIRRAYHAGSWYDDNPEVLDNTLSNFLADASENKTDAYETESTTDSENNGTSGGRHSGIPRACISPHAGFQYSGPTAAYSFLALKEAIISNPSLRTVVVLHPSHHVYLDGCAVSGEFNAALSDLLYTIISYVQH